MVGRYAYNCTKDLFIKQVYLLWPGVDGFCKLIVLRSCVFDDKT